VGGRNREWVGETGSGGVERANIRSGNKRGDMGNNLRQKKKIT
jgi:hypothetical protein